MTQELLDKLEVILNRPIPDKFDSCIEELKILGDFYLHEFSKHERNEDEPNLLEQMDSKLPIIKTKLKSITDKLQTLSEPQPLEGGKRLKKTTKKPSKNIRKTRKRTKHHSRQALSS